MAHGVFWAPHMADVWKPAWTSIACTKPAWRFRDKVPAPPPAFVPHQGEWDLWRPQSQPEPRARRRGHETHDQILGLIELSAVERYATNKCSGRKKGRIC